MSREVQVRFCESRAVQSRPATHLWLVRVDAARIAEAEGYQQRVDSSLYVVPLQRPVPPGEARYIRVRWRLLESRELWQRNRRTKGARVDFRVCDVRESRFVQRERSLRERLCEISSINFFLMAPAHLQPTSHSPEFRYLRVLEPGAWRTYLEGAAYSRFNRGVLVYYWRYASKRTTTPAPQNSAVSLNVHTSISDSAARGSSSSGSEPISADNPFRVFIELHRPHSQRWLIPKFILAVLIAASILRFTPSTIPELSLPSLSSTQILTILGLFGIPAVFAGVQRLRRWSRNRLLAQRRRLRVLERGLLNLTRWKR